MIICILISRIKYLLTVLHHSHRFFWSQNHICILHTLPLKNFHLSIRCYKNKHTLPMRCAVCLKICCKFSEKSFKFISHLSFMNNIWAHRSRSEKLQTSIKKLAFWRSFSPRKSGICMCFSQIVGHITFLNKKIGRIFVIKLINNKISIHTFEDLATSLNRWIQCNCLGQIRYLLCVFRVLRSHRFWPWLQLHFW